jgi:hypothetical protein
MSSSNPAELASVHVRSQGGPVRITLLDHRFRPVDPPGPGVGEFHWQGPPGLYILQYDTGWVSEQRHLDLEPGTAFTEEDLRVQFPSAAPVPGTSGYQEQQANAAHTLSVTPQAPPNTDLGVGARLMLFARTIEQGKPLPSLAKVSLLDRQLRPQVAPLTSDRSDTQHGCLGWCADLAPGYYVLRWAGAAADAPALDQGIWAADSWTTILFLTGQAEEKSAAVPERSGDAPTWHFPSDLTIHLARREAGFLPLEPDAVAAQLAMELALAGWRTGKPLIDPASLDRLLDAKFGNPMLGIVGAHLLLEEAAPDRDLVLKVLDNLEMNLIPGCPDMRALRAIARRRFDLEEAVPLLDWPPMFKASFKGAIAADWDGHGVISPGRLADRVAPCLVPLSPWTTWAALPAAPPGPETQAGSVGTALPKPFAFCPPAAEEPDLGEAEFLGTWLRRVLPSLPFVEGIADVLGFDWQTVDARELWRRFSAWPDVTMQKLAVQLRGMYHFAQRSGGLLALEDLDLAGVARGLNLPQTSVASAAILLARDLVTRAYGEGNPMHEHSGAAEGSWPPENGQEYIRSEEFGTLLLDIVAQLAQRYPERDFTDGAAHVFAWFDSKLKQNRRFINPRRFPTESAFRAYVRQSLWNAALMAERSRRRGQAMRPLPAEQELVYPAPTPEQEAILHESLEALPQPHKTILEQFLLEEKDLDLIAETFDMTRSQVEKLYEEAIDQLSLE